MEENKEIALEIQFGQEEITIPFKSIEEIDEITSKFNNKTELEKAFFPNMQRKPDVFRIKYKYSFTVKEPDEKNPGKFKYKKIVRTVYPDIKYIDDNFNERDLKNKFSNFMALHPEQQLDKYWGLKYIIENRRIKNNMDGPLLGNEVDYAINYMFEKGYKTKRDIYFKLKKLGIQIRINREKNAQNRIQNYEMRDEYQEYLKNLSKKGEDEEAFAMEELSLYDLDKMPKKEINGDGEPLFDGVGTEYTMPQNKLVRILQNSNRISKISKGHVLKVIDGNKK